VELFARALAAKLGLGGSGGDSSRRGEMARGRCERSTKTAKAHHSSSLANSRPAEVHALAHAINAALAMLGQRFTTAEPVGRILRITSNRCGQLCADIDGGKVETLADFGRHPVYTAPHDFDFASKIKFDEKKIGRPVKNTIYVGLAL